MERCHIDLDSSQDEEIASSCNGKAYNISRVFFGFCLLQIGYLTFGSTFLPRWLGPIVALGVGWIVFLYPPLAHALSRYIILASVGEILLVLWLLVKGVDDQHWHEQAAAAGLGL